MVDNPDYIDRTLLRLRREYSKDEVVGALSKQLSERDVEIGQLKSEIEHLNYLLNQNENEREINREARKEIRKELLYKQQSLKIQTLENKLQAVYRVRDELIERSNSYENQLKKYLKKDSE